MGTLSQLQLRPQERRLLVLGAAILFVVLNLWFVWPHYGQLGRLQNQIRRHEQTLHTYRTEMTRTNDYLAQLQALEVDGGGVLDRDKDLNLMNIVQAEMSRSGITHTSFNITSHGTNAFFEQSLLSINLSPTTPDALVAFLVSLATNQVALRVRELDVKPADRNRFKLACNLRIVASYQRPAPNPPGTTTVAAAPRP